MCVDRVIDKLRERVKINVKKKKFENAMVVAGILSEIYYNYNQIYSDFELEDQLEIIGTNILKHESYIVNQNCVLFYDGFGLDLRGWALSYIKALSDLGYFIVYVCPCTSKNKIPHIMSELNKVKSEVVYLNLNCSHVNRAKEIDRIFKNYRPNAAFFYTTPYDVEGAIAFGNNESSTRFQIDLTDHAYWIGVKAFDYAIECREMGASLAVYERGIKKEQILKLDCAPYINLERDNKPLPFDIHSEKYIFTGGALYKTLGDPELLYYKTVSHILGTYNEIKFLYAGSGDDSEVTKLMDKYPNRVFLIDERQDFYELIKNSVLYLNSYPMFGGLMMRYAAIAHKIPITLKHDNDADGILINQDKLGIEFEDYNDYINEIDKLLSDDLYRKEQEYNVGQSVITADIFKKNIECIIKEHKTQYKFEIINRLNTNKFRKEYKNRYKKSVMYRTIAKKGQPIMIMQMPIVYLIGLIVRIKEKVVR